MSITKHILTKYPFSCIIVIGTWILCFMTIPETPLSSVRFIDKWTHCLILLSFGPKYKPRIFTQYKAAQPQIHRCMGLVDAYHHGRTH